jgi:hypothetical protein
VGENAREEMSRASANGGDNLGWPYYEGTNPVEPSCPGLTRPPDSALRFPILEVIRTGGSYAIIAGPVYQGQAAPGGGAFPAAYQGVVFASDYYNQFLYALRFDCQTNQWVKIPGATSEFFATGLAGGVSDFAVGPEGAVYYISQFTSSIRKIAYTGPIAGATKTYTVTPCRILDTRTAGAGGPIGANACRPVHVVGALSFQGGASTCGIPANAIGVHINVVAVSPPFAGHLTVYPYGSSLPLASVLNFSPGQTVANGVLIPICDPNVSMCSQDLLVQTGPSSTHAVIDVTGYVAPAP